MTRTTGRILLGVLLVLTMYIVRSSAAHGSRESTEAVRTLLEADRGFSAAGRDKGVLTALSAMFAEDVVVPVPGGRFVEGKQQVLDAMRSDPLNRAHKVEWTPIRGGVSADGTHGFTFGYMRVQQEDGRETALKYLSYWVNQGKGWRVIAYRRSAARLNEAASARQMSFALPASGHAADRIPDVQCREGLAATEQQFSAEAQKTGLTAAFAKFGSDDAVNLGGADAPTFLVGAQAIAEAVGRGTPTDSSPVRWAADYKVLVAGSCDVGVTFGYIRSNTDPARSPLPFFTVWRRSSTSLPWRYVAE